MNKKDFTFDCNIIANSAMLQVIIDCTNKELVPLCNADEAEKMCDIIDKLEMAQKELEQLKRENYGGI